MTRPFTNKFKKGWKKGTDPMVGGARSITLYDACTPPSAPPPPPPPLMKKLDPPVLNVHGDSVVVPNTSLTLPSAVPFYSVPFLNVPAKNFQHAFTLPRKKNNKCVALDCMIHCQVIVVLLFIDKVSNGVLCYFSNPSSVQKRTEEQLKGP